MSTTRKHRRPGAARRLSDGPLVLERRRPKYARWRALSLILVYVVFAVHIIHWKLKGKTLAPLELNEVMYTLELGIITAGCLFMCLLVVGTLIFGRFFCSWACHIMALQDLCAWILRKLRIRRKAIRSRTLLLVPPLTAFYMFIWPQIMRAWHSRSFPAFHLRTDSEGWASFATNDFWRNLPSAPITVLTLCVCGFFIVYLLGTRTFCTYVCPYGAIFSVADRFAPGRIRVDDTCQQCGTCTAVCTSSVRVHEEVKKFGMIVNPACLKDLDCVSACPQNALHYRFGKPSLFKSYRGGGRFGRPYEYSWPEDLLLGVVCLVVVFSFRGLYSRIPFLLSLALGGIMGYLAVTTLRLATRSELKVVTLRLKRSGRLTAAGMAYAGLAPLLAAFVGHSAYVRYHEFSGLRQARALNREAHPEELDALAASAHAHLLAADRWGLLANERIERSLVKTSMHLNRMEEAQAYAQRALRHHPEDDWVRLQLGLSLVARGRGGDGERHFRAIVAAPDDRAREAPSVRASAHQALAGLLGRRGDFAGAADQLRAALALDPERAALFAELGSLLAELGQLEEAVASLLQAVRLDPGLGDAEYNLGTILAHEGRFADAIPHYERAVALAPTDAALRNNLGFALLRLERFGAARAQLEQAVALNPDNADAHFNLGSLCVAQRRMEQAAEHFSAAAHLDPRYARLLQRARSQ